MLHAEAQRDLIAGLGVGEGVLAQLQQRLRDALGIGDDRAGCAGVDHPGPVAQRSRLAEHVLRELTGVDLPQLDEVRLVGSRQHDQVVDHARHPVDLVEHQVARGLDVVGVLGIDQLEVAADDGDRGAQLVSGVVEELPVGGERDSSRSSIALKVRASSVRSSLPVVSSRWVRSVSEISRAVSLSWCSGRRSRLATSQAPAVTSSSAMAATTV